MANKEELPDKLPPKNIEAEKSLLGGLLMDKDAIYKIIDFFQVKDFYEKKHEQIYRCLVDITERSGSIDLLSVANRLEEKELLDQIGGNSYLTELVNSVPTASHVEEYARIVQKKRIRREMIQAGQEISLTAYREDQDVEEVLDEAEQKIFNISQNSLRNRFLRVGDALEDAFQRIERLSTQDEDTRGVPSGFHDLDDVLSGFQKSDLILLAARPSMGKSSLAFNIAQNVAVNKNIPVGIFSLEMSNDQIIDKLLSSTSGVNLWKIRNGKLSTKENSNDYSKIQEAMHELSDAPIYIEDKSSFNIMQMKAMARRLQAENGLGLIIIDYLQLIQPRSNATSMVQQMTEISRALKGLAKELNVPVISLSQLSRAVEKRTPQIPRLSDLRESGALEQDADVVLLMYREEYYREDTERQNITDLIIAKHRNGPTGKVELYFDENTTSFRSLDKKHTN
jgi:replicative DNA helicase